MGAAASVKLVFSEAVEWFSQYFDGVLYVEDYRSLDKNGDGGITFEEMSAWIKEKAAEGSAWKLMVSNMSIFAIAHSLTSKAGNFELEEKKIVGLEAFKSFLIHLFVLSILWVHFKHADSWQEGQDVGNESLTLNEFKMACRTFSSAQANETLTEAKIQADFDMLDTDKSGSVDFLEVCNYCSKFVDPDFASKFITERTAASKRIASIDDHEEVGPLSPKSTAGNSKLLEATPEDGSLKVDRAKSKDAAVQAVADEMTKNEKIANFEEIKVNTEIMLGVL
mmetsp:Transcript_11533/g.18913  ORF Transcript_11533/g.18913 Transcript_11533/m.18913 type:complete len:280 (+) Transcript_11533:87-926(+)|eukprot:CAMPEP_0174986048 /NCGR_PEP_ID=MMETSP0004_2-20121128/18701_1 /TAXON_ID=420556 /ORGANISM="Ochromonas sp., Strain CCMP1393" /LENGTH=279 /DNA_ID=CAMNT_0016238805 /DNA_START=81 /DNA_END=920 /DNA_ORIENTATION=-